MGEIPVGTQLQIYGLDGLLGEQYNGRACACLGSAPKPDQVQVRLGNGKEIAVQVSKLRKVAGAGTLPVDSRVIIVGLTKAAELNTRCGTVTRQKAPAGRVNIDIGDGVPKSIKHENVVLIDPEAAARALSKQGQVGGVGGAVGGVDSDLTSFPLGTRVTVTHFVDPGLNGKFGVVLGTPFNESGRLLVMMEMVARSIAVENLRRTGDVATSSELESFQGPLRDKFYVEVRKFLWSLPHDEPLSTLLNPTKQSSPWSPVSRVFSAWTAYHAACGRKSKGISMVLRDRQDLFEFSYNTSGSEMIGLTNHSRKLNVVEGFPEPPKPQTKDDVARKVDKEKKDEIARGLFSAVELCGAKGEGISLSQVGTDVKVMKLRKDPHFKNVRLTDIIREYPNVFDLYLNGPAGWYVKLKEEAEIALPMREAGESAPMGGGDVLPDPEELLLPDKLLDPESLSDKMQAMRIEIMHALQRRNGRAQTHQLGQEPGVQKMKRELLQANKRLIDLVGIFPKNFSVARDEEDGKLYVYLESKDVEDKSPIESWMRRLGGGSTTGCPVVIDLEAGTNAATSPAQAEVSSVSGSTRSSRKRRDAPERSPYRPPRPQPHIAPPGEHYVPPPPQGQQVALGSDPNAAVAAAYAAGIAAGQAASAAAVAAAAAHHHAAAYGHAYMPSPAGYAPPPAYGYPQAPMGPGHQGYNPGVPPVSYGPGAYAYPSPQAHFGYPPPMYG
eukprot:TRINITY_DN4007_c0_g1_i1.p1 TRINITY_DN4007_c0_g1~~TRINITY_DN4007_c0_g1_i1.p1  ORF type:complete len:724 (+),score=104.44 TRINITY_DN4007_c0_g1_i1:360-2531(+)